LIKISEGGIERIPEKLQPKDAGNLKCIISEINGKYYWASRENKSLNRNESGAYITFFALDGSGYIRIIKSNFKDAVSILGNTEKEFDYVEHLLTGLKSITYYGKYQ